MSEELKRAGLFVRTVAKILDFILIAAAVELIPKAGFFAGLAYLLIGDGFFDGRSIGKKLIGLRVVSADTYRTCTFRDSVLRNSTLALGYFLFHILWFGWVFMLLVIVLEFIVLLGSRNRMRIGDEIAKTLVIDSPENNPQAKQEE
ncbi:MAG: RDD family protein [Thermodesulfovibrionales bacterium]|nr:RDD family protein [Thermodesulfovibrionales bacterium]